MKEIIEEMLAALNEIGHGKPKADVAYSVTSVACLMVSKLAIPGKEVDALVASATLFLDYANKLQLEQDAIAGITAAPGWLN